MFTLERTGFGRAAALRWKTSNSPMEQTRINAANLQHLYCVRIRERMTKKLMTAKQFAEASNISYDRLLKVLRGDIIMRLEDIAAADLILGEVSEFARKEAMLLKQPDARRG
jgi:predicted transcriptional regulator